MPSGYAVYGGSQLVIPSMVADPANLELFAQLRTDAEGLTEPFAALGMVGSVVGLLLLSDALWRAKLGPKWIPVTLWALLAVEFVGTALSPAAGMFRPACYLRPWSPWQSSSSVPRSLPGPRHSMCPRSSSAGTDHRGAVSAG